MSEAHLSVAQRCGRERCTTHLLVPRTYVGIFLKLPPNDTRRWNDSCWHVQTPLEMLTTPCSEYKPRPRVGTGRRCLVRILSLHGSSMFSCPSQATTTTTTIKRPSHRPPKKQGEGKKKKTQPWRLRRPSSKRMRDLGIEPRAPRRCSDGNGEFYH